MITNQKILGIYRRRDEQLIVMFFSYAGTPQLCEMSLRANSLELRTLTNYAQHEFPKIQRVVNPEIWDCLYHDV